MYRLLLLVMGLAFWSQAKSEETTGVIDSTPNKSVCFEGMTSKDGRYAIGWTLRTRNKTAKSVDWSLFDPGSPIAFLDKYDWDATESPNAPYELEDCLIDLKTMTTVDLPSTNPDFPNKNRLAVVWSDSNQSSRYVLIQNDARFYTENLWLVVIDHGKPRVKDLAKSMDVAVDALVREKKTISLNEYEVLYPISEPETAPIASFTDKEVRISFLSDMRKSLDPTSQVIGTITLQLPEGKVIKATSSTPVDNPFKDDARLGQADGDLNKVYTKLYRKLSDVQQQALKQQQLHWITFVRDAAGTEIQLHDDGDNIQSRRNQALLEATQARTAELKHRLDAIP